MSGRVSGNKGTLDRWLNSTPGRSAFAWGIPARLFSFAFGFVTGIFALWFYCDQSFRAVLALCNIIHYTRNCSSWLGIAVFWLIGYWLTSSLSWSILYSDIPLLWTYLIGRGGQLKVHPLSSIFFRILYSSPITILDWSILSAISFLWFIFFSIVWIHPSMWTGDRK